MFCSLEFTGLLTAKKLASASARDDDCGWYGDQGQKDQ